MASSYFFHNFVDRKEYTINYKLYTSSKIMATQFTDQNVKERIARGKPVVIDCWATWCGPCVRMSPIIDELAEQFGDKAVIGKYNIDEQSDLTAEHRIMSIPTILFFKEGKLVDRLAGSQPKSTLEDKINALIG